MNLAIIELSFWLRLIIKKNRVFFHYSEMCVLFFLSFINLCPWDNYYGKLHLLKCFFYKDLFVQLKL